MKKSESPSDLHKLKKKSIFSCLSMKDFCNKQMRDLSKDVLEHLHYPFSIKTNFLVRYDVVLSLIFVATKSYEG